MVSCSFCCKYSFPLNAWRSRRHASRPSPPGSPHRTNVGFSRDGRAMYGYPTWDHVGMGLPSMATTMTVVSRVPSACADICSTGGTILLVSGLMPSVLELDDGKTGRKLSCIWAGTMGLLQIFPTELIQSSARYGAFRFTISVRAPQTGRIGAGGGKGRAVAKIGDPIKTKGFS